MAQVITLATARKEIPPKAVTYEHGGQRYTCRFDPNAPKEEQWVWTVAYTRVYRYFGRGPTMEAVASRARRKIHTLNMRRIEQEEADVSK